MALSQVFGDNALVQAENDTAVTITVAEVTFDDQLALYKTDASGLWADYKIRNRYVDNAGVYMNGVTSPAGFNGTSVSFVQLSAQTLLWVAEWSALKVGDQPEAPGKTPSDSNWVYLKGYREPVMIVTAADGQTPLYRLNGVYVFGHKNPSPDVVANINYAVPPYLYDPFDRTQPATKMVQGIIDGHGASRGNTNYVPGGPGGQQGGRGTTNGPQTTPGVPGY